MFNRLSFCKSDKLVQVNLPTSKSISNRLLIIRKLSGVHYEIQNLSQASDTQLLNHLLNIPPSKLFDAKNAGTTFRFLLAYLAITQTKTILTGDKRMQQRPIEILVDALIQLGAKIEYLDNQGFPPVRICSRKMATKSISVDASVSSQYVTALLMIAPILPNGLTIRLNGKLLSMPYILMTIKLMRQLGIECSISENVIIVKHGKYDCRQISIEPDWSSASYWYEIVALTEGSEVFIKGLKQKSIQGDSILPEIYSELRVKTIWQNEGALLQNVTRRISVFKYDFINNPDIFQTLAVTCAMLHIPFEMSGLDNLRIKETDRIKAVQNELSKFGVETKYSKDGNLSWNGKISSVIKPNSLIINTYKDHRMAMAFAPAVVKTGFLKIENPQVVIKSYPDFWTDMDSFGLILH